MKLFHISRDVNLIERFTPRIPKYANKIEAKESRICMSDSIEGCISATEQWLSKIINNNTIVYDEFTEVMVYEFDTNDILDYNLITPEVLKIDKNVFDADLLKEHWIINQEIIPRQNYLIKLLSADCVLVKRRFTEKELMLNKLFGNEDKEEYFVKELSNLKYIKIELNEYKKFIYENFDSDIITTNFDFGRDINSFLKMYINKQLEIRDNKDNEVTKIFKILLKQIEKLSI